MSSVLPQSNRIDLVDALRGFALFAIVLLHNLEHFNLYSIPADMPKWLMSLDGIVWNTTFFLMAGKAFSIFAMLFGFSFFVQFASAEKRGYDFRWRFVWRMVILLVVLAQFHSFFYNGDILFLYAVIGILLTPLCKASNKLLFYIGLFLLLQPYEVTMMIYSLANPDFVAADNLSWPYYGPMLEVMKNGSFWEVVSHNITDGQIWNNLWQIEDGRVFKTAGLFIFGMLLGRLKYFVKSSESIKFWGRVLTYSTIAFVPLYCIQNIVPAMIESKSALAQFNIVLPSYAKLSFMLMLLSSFSLLWFCAGNGYKFQRFIIPYGRMSLTNYISQSILGCFIYLGYGLGLYEFAGSTLSIIIGVAIFVGQLAFSRWWLNRHKQGPLEYVWKRLTWICSSQKAK